MSFPSMTRRLGQWAVACVLGAMLPAACSNPLRANAPGTGGATSPGGATATGGHAGSQPITITLGLGGMSATGGVTGAGGVSGVGGTSSSGGALSTGGTPSTSTTECTAGRCLVTLASGREHIWRGIAVDGANVYWTEQRGTIPAFPGTGDGRVMKVPLGGGTPTMLASGQDFPSHIRVDATSVYWTTWSTGVPPELFVWGNASVIRALPDGSKISKVASVDLYPYGYPVYGDIAVDATTVYWAYEGTSDKDYVDGSILRVSLDDGSIATLASGQWRPNQIAVDASSVYWVNGTSPDDTDTVLMKMPLGGGAVTTLDASPSGHTAFALDATNVYWVSDSGGTVMKLSLAGGTPVTIATGQPGPTEIAVDTASVYWANRVDGTIMKVPLAGGPSTTLACRPALGLRPGRRRHQRLLDDPGNAWQQLPGRHRDEADPQVACPCVPRQLRRIRALRDPKRDLPAWSAPRLSSSGQEIVGRMPGDFA